MKDVKNFGVNISPADDFITSQTLQRRNFIALRRYQPDDYTAVAEIFQRAIRETANADYTPEQIAAWAASADDAARFGWSLADNIAYVAEWEGRTAGFADMTTDGYIDRVYTHPAFQGKGVATALLNQLIADARDIGLRQVHLESSITARTFYIQYGFTEQGKVERNKGKLVYVNTIMERVIT